jgi:hypothetical protein
MKLLELLESWQWAEKLKDAEVAAAIGIDPRTYKKLREGVFSADTITKVITWAISASKPADSKPADQA